MKRRCMCPKPHYVSADKSIGGAGVKHDLLFTSINTESPILHFKVATTECEKCGRGLCSDCRSTPRLPFIVICPSCTEVICQN